MQPKRAHYFNKCTLFMYLSLGKILKQASGESLQSPEVKQGEADFISTQFSFWLVGDCVASWLQH